ncbi:caspase-1-like [Epargyreus clarus]|uniref:caspase-1-like n=1 Tax=Epargyreus clarus TaxID=520877 RepID=UPI003C2FC641
MDDTWRNEKLSASEVDFEYAHRKRGRRRKGKNPGTGNTQARNTQPVATDARNSDEELVESEDSTVHEPEVFENTPNEEPSASLASDYKKRLLLDAVMITPPKIVASKSIDEDVVEPQGDFGLLTNTKALHKEARTYELEKFQKNCLIIFNQESIEGFEPRLGTKQDVDVLTATFENYGFEVIEHKNFTKEQIIEVLETFKTKNFTEYGCVAVAVLTHGTFNGLLRAKDQVYSEMDIIKYFRVYDKPTLITKPKVLIIQACRGTRCLPGVPVFQMQSSKIRKDLDEDVEPYTLPVTSDMLIVHSSYVGEPSTRDELHGSWFIQTLCRKINELALSHDLESILTEVKREIAADRHWEEYNRLTREIDSYKQMPTVTSTLIRKLFLRRFGDENLPMTFLDSPGTSRNTALDTAPTTPMLVQFGPCSCFLDHFDYIKKCLLHFLEEHPSDSTARTFLDISNTFENEDKFNAAKEKMAKAICDHLTNNARHCEYFKYLYFYKH